MEAMTHAHMTMEYGASTGAALPAVARTALPARRQDDSLRQFVTTSRMMHEAMDVPFGVSDWCRSCAQWLRQRSVA